MFQQADIYFKELEKESFLKNLPMEHFCNRLAYYKTEINLVHPFREGNGRVIRLFIESLAKHNGYERKRQTLHTLTARI